MTSEQLRRHRVRQQWETFRVNAPAIGGHIEGDDSGVVQLDNNDNPPPGGGHLELQQIPAGGGAGEAEASPNMLRAYIGRLRGHLGRG